MNAKLTKAVCLIFAASTLSVASATALPNDGQVAAHRLFIKVSCDTHNEDKQARCMQACDDTWIKATQAYNANIDRARGEKKACETKCGC